MWIKCKEDNTPINLNTVIKIRKKSNSNSEREFLIDFLYSYYSCNYDTWYFEKESRRNEVYSKILNLLNIQEL